LQDHLKRFYPNLSEEEEEEDKGNLKNMYRVSSSESGSSGSQRSIKSINSYFKRSTMYDNTSVKKKELDTALMWMICLDFQPYNIVEHKGFRDFVLALDPRYNLPSKHTLKYNYINKEYYRGVYILKEILYKTQYIAITCDTWTSSSTETYLSATCHFINSDFELKSAILSIKKLLDVTNHTAENIANSLESIFLEWNIRDKIICIVTDNASAMIKACELLKIKNLPCFAHTVNLVVQDSIKFECVKEIMTKCKTIVTFFKSSSTAMEKFKIEQNTEKPRTLIQEVPTRWNSMFAMIKRILETNEAICKTLLNTRKAPQPLTARFILSTTCSSGFSTPIFPNASTFSLLL